MLSLLFAISLKFSRTCKKVVINSFCCFLFLNYGKKVGLLRVTRLSLKQVSISLETSCVFLERQLQKHFFCLKFDFTTTFLITRLEFFLEKLAKNILERNVSAKEDPCCKSHKIFASC